ncbi:hypothetical protein VPH47_12560 [Stenotrophomonas sp. WED208]|uniref:hypothetical protein n=1 Tax=Stenotrophomonas sp. WED208 TaxID=3112800 RepID=UPI0034D56DE9
MASGRLADYLGKGLASARPATLTLHPEAVGLWYSTDTGVISTWDGSSWHDVTSGASTRLAIVTKTASATLALTDALSGRDALVEMDVATANTLTVPPNGAIAFEIGTVINVHQRGAGQTTIVQGAGVTVRTDETLKLRKQWATAVLIKRGTDEWVLAGSLEAAP